jgi:hypothetical protein
MEHLKSHWNEIEATLNEMAEMQKNKLLAYGRRLVPSLTTDDILQPNDFPVLENHPEFRYEEGLLAGIQSVQIALQALKHDSA